jgi:hypothetical protein
MTVSYRTGCVSACGNAFYAIRQTRHNIDAHKTAAEIQQMLARAGASAILTEFDNTGNIVALSFKMILPDDTSWVSSRNG